MKFIVLRVNYGARPVRDPVIVIHPHAVFRRIGVCVLGSMYLHRNQSVFRRVLCMLSLFPNISLGG